MKPVFYSTAQPTPFIQLGEARDQVVHNPGDDDHFLQRIVRAAVELVEKDSGWMLGARPAVVRWMDPKPVTPCRHDRSNGNHYLASGFIGPVLELPPELNPILSVESIRYRDSTGGQFDLANHQIELHHRPAFVVMQPNIPWPTITAGYIDSLRIECTAGLNGSSTSRCTELAKQAALLLVGHWYENREAIGTVGKAIELAYDTLIESLKLYRYEGK